MATHSSVLAWRIPRTEEPGGLQSMWSQKSDVTERLTHRHVRCWLTQAFFLKRFWSPHLACEVLVPGPGIKATPPALETWSLNQWTSRKSPTQIF